MIYKVNKNIIIIYEKICFPCTIGTESSVDTILDDFFNVYMYFSVILL